MSALKMLITPLLFASFSLICNEASEYSYTQLDIAAVENLTPEKVTIQNKRLRLVATAANAKVQALQKPFHIPFISIIESIKEYKDSLYGRAYIPKKALLVYLGSKKLGIWENEMGVMLSPDPETSLDNQSKLMTALNKRAPKNKKEIMSVLRLLLLIDKQGNISLRNLESFLP